MAMKELDRGYCQSCRQAGAQILLDSGENNVGYGMNMLSNFPSYIVGTE